MITSSNLDLSAELSVHIYQGYTVLTYENSKTIQSIKSFPIAILNSAVSSSIPG